MRLHSGNVFYSRNRVIITVWTISADSCVWCVKWEWQILTCFYVHACMVLQFSQKKKSTVIPYWLANRERVQMNCSCLHKSGSISLIYNGSKMCRMDSQLARRTTWKLDTEVVTFQTFHILSSKCWPMEEVLDLFHCVNFIMIRKLYRHWWASSKEISMANLSKRPLLFGVLKIKQSGYIEPAQTLNNQKQPVTINRKFFNITITRYTSSHGWSLPQFFFFSRRLGYRVPQAFSKWRIREPSRNAVEKTNSAGVQSDCGIE